MRTWTGTIVRERTRAPALEVLGRRCPGVPLGAPPAQLGPRVDVASGEASAATLMGEPLHLRDARPCELSAPCAPLAAADHGRAGSELVTEMAPPAHEPTLSRPALREQLATPPRPRAPGVPRQRMRRLSMVSAHIWGTKPRSRRAWLSSPTRAGSRIETEGATLLPRRTATDRRRHAPVLRSARAQA